MPYRYQQLHSGYFHVYNRGNNKEDIFHDGSDYCYFLNRLNQYRLKYKVIFICYCLMPNHFHFLIRVSEGSSLVNFMKYIQMVYAKYYYKKYNTVGHLFEGRYKAKEIKKELYFLYLTAYIHANPLSSGLVENLRNWQWSSFLDYVSKRGGIIPDKELIFNYFKLSVEYEKWVIRVGKQKAIDKLGDLILE